MNIAIITGASSGLGIEFIKALKSYGLDEIIIIARRRERLEELKEEKVYPLALDVTSDDDLEILKNTLREKGAEVKFLINNAGRGLLDDFADADIDALASSVDLNCKALTQVTSIVLPYMKEGASIINVSSIASFAPTARMAVYGATKAYVTSFSRALREELKKRKIGVTAVCPGPMETEFLLQAKIEKGTSTAFDLLPYCNPEKVAKGAVKSALRRKAVYTPTAFYKLYRILAKIIPHSIVVKFSKT